jgi:predicted DNA-binding transcriptional regulator AlpA
VVGLCPDHAAKLAREGRFPPLVRIGPRASGWLEQDVRDWLEKRRDEAAREAAR